MTTKRQGQSSASAKQSNKKGKRGKKVRFAPGTFFYDSIQHTQAVVNKNLKQRLNDQRIRANEERNRAERYRKKLGKSEVELEEWKREADTSWNEMVAMYQKLEAVQKECRKGESEVAALLTVVSDLKNEIEELRTPFCVRVTRVIRVMFGGMFEDDTDDE